MSKNSLVMKIIQPIMELQGFQLETDQRTFWRWHKLISGIEEEVCLMNIQRVVRLTLGRACHGVACVLGEDLLCALDNPRTTSEDWFDYGRMQKSREAKYKEILYDIRDILEANTSKLLQEHAEKVKRAIPNKGHFETLRDSYEELAEEYSERYVKEDMSILDIMEVIMHHISQMFDKELGEVENDLLGYAAILYSQVEKRYGGDIRVDENQESIMLVKTGKQRRSFNYCVDMFAVWKNPEWFKQYYNNFVWWYNHECICKIEDK